jgi:cytochrome P450
MIDVMDEYHASKPPHVPAELVRAFDIYHIPGATEDVHAAYAAVQKSSPDIFWTPANGGHWVITNGEDILTILRDTVRFSSTSTILPPMPETDARQIPLEIDPPDHAHYRRPLMEALRPSRVNAMQDDIRHLAVQTIEQLKPAGGCEFIADFAKILPIHVFLKLVDLPLEDKDALLSMVEGAVRGHTVEERQKSQQLIKNYLAKAVRERRSMPGSDILSLIVNIDIGGQLISETEAIDYAMLFLSGGLDTVASMMGFIIKYLAESPVHRRILSERINDERFVMFALEELMRRHGIANISRVITTDMTLRGVELKAGDRILPANAFVGLDERLNPDPLNVNFDRPKPIMAVFGYGAHACPGAVLARRELRIFLQEWLSRIPDFQIRPDSKPLMATGMVNTVLRLELVWPANS